MASKAEMTFGKGRKNIAFYGVLIAILIYVGRVQELSSLFFSLKLGKIVMYATMFLYIVSPKRRVRPSILSFFQVKCVLIIASFGFLSILLSVHPRVSFEFMFIDYLKLLVFFLLLVRMIISPDDLKKMNFMFLISIFFIAFFIATSKESGRVYVTASYDPNDTAFVMVTAMPIIYFMALQKRGPARYALFSLVVIILYAIIRTASRGGYIGLIATAIFITLMDKKTVWIKKVVVISLLSISFAALMTVFYSQRIDTLRNINEDYNVTEMAGRLNVWKRGVGYMLRNPMTGIGAGAFSIAEGTLSNNRYWSAPHNSFVQIGAELGPIALTMQIILVVGCFRQLGRMRKTASRNIFLKDKEWLMTALQISFLSYSVAGSFLSQGYACIFYFLVAECAILRRMELAGASYENGKNG